MEVCEKLSESILLVDDEPANLQILLETLKSVGCRLLVAKDGQSALTIARKARPNLILLDIMMPEIDGFEVCRRLKADPVTQDTPVIFLSALVETADKIKGFQAGAVDYVTKPFQPEEVMARVKTHLTIHRLRREVREQKDKLEHELKIVSTLQRKLLPEQLPQIGNLALDVHYETSFYSGGDYYDIVELPDRCWGVLLADAEGHGAPAAVMMAMTCALFRSFPQLPVDPAAVITHMNRHLKNAYESSFVTAIYGIYQPEKRIFQIARAGHPLPMIYRASERRAFEADCPGVLPLGIESYDHVPVVDIVLEPGDRLLLYTDGITERFNPGGETYGEERLLQLLGAGEADSPRKVIAGIVEDLERFAGGRPAEDDQALVVGIVG